MKIFDYFRSGIINFLSAWKRIPIVRRGEDVIGKLNFITRPVWNEEDEIVVNEELFGK